MRFNTRTFSLSLASLVTIFYAVLSFHIYFRHDDWLMLGNSAIILPRDWSFLWKTSWFVSPSISEVWFFRPWFKLLVWLGYHLFALHSELWTLTHWSFLLASATLSGLALNSLTSSSRSFYFFFNLFLISFSLHFACVVWMGEGMMNAPQLLFLSLSLWCFSKNSQIGNIFSALFYFLSLGFKESSAFLPVFLLAISFSQGELFRRWKWLAFFMGLMVIYLIIRLFFLPFNPGYKPHWSYQNFFTPLFYFIVTLGIPFISFTLMERPGIKDFKHLIKRHLAFLPFLGLLIAPHLGHPFFSPGWFLLPGFFGLWIFVYCLPSQKLNQLKAFKILGLVLLLSAAPVIWKVRDLRWIEWEKSQKQVQHFLETLPEETDRIWIETCNSKEIPQIHFQRVVGSQGNLEFMSLLLGKKSTPVEMVACNSVIDSKLASETIAYGKWIFPDFLFKLKK